MKITIRNEKKEDIKLGDFLIIHDSDGEKLVRQIVKFKDYYFALDVEKGSWGFYKDTIKELYEDYVNTYGKVRVVKNSDVEMIIGGR